MESVEMPTKFIESDGVIVCVKIASQWINNELY